MEMQEALMEINEGGQKFIDRVSSPGMFRAYMLVKAPVLGVTGAYLEALDTHSARLVIPATRRIKNLFGDTFSAAIIAGAEIVSASMLVLHIRNQEAALTAQLASLHYVRHAAADSDLKILAHQGAAYANFVASAKEEGPQEAEFSVKAVNESGDITHEVALTWRLLLKD